MAQSSIKNNSDHPVWNESFEFLVDFKVENLKFELFDDDEDSSDILGTCEFLNVF